MHTIPSVVFNGAGDTLRVSPGPLPAMRKLSFRMIPHKCPAQFLHSQNAAI